MKQKKDPKGNLGEIKKIETFVRKLSWFNLEIVE